MPNDLKKQIQSKINKGLDEQKHKEDAKRQHEKDILNEFARVYGYDINKHQPNPNNGEIDVEYL